MSELSPEARALLRDGLGALRPVAHDRARIAGALASRLGPAAMLLSKSAVAAPVKAALLPKLAITAASVGLVVAGASYWWSPPAVAPAARAASSVQGAAAAQPVAAPEPLADVRPAPAPEVRPSSPELKTPPAKSAAVDPLATEVAILSRAMTALRAGNATEALRLLETHRQQFPSGRLIEERRAGRLQALCALGRRSEAASELARLEREAPRSPHVARAKRACGLD